MKKTKKLEFNAKLLFFIFVLNLTFLLSCTKDNSIEYENHLRKSFLKDKSFAKIKEDFNNLTEQEKVSLWSEKLDQLLDQNLPKEHSQLIKELKIEIEKPAINIENISKISVRLADITPEDGFYQMFTTLDNYNFKGYFIGSSIVNDDMKNSLKSLRFNYLKNNEIINSTAKTNGGKPCNCNWTCSLYAGGSTSKCTPTTSGCGFLWAFECEQRVGPTLDQAFPADEMN